MQYHASAGSDGWTVDASTPVEALAAAIEDAEEWSTPSVGDWSVSLRIEIWPMDEDERDVGYPLAAATAVYDPEEPPCVDEDGDEDDTIEHEWTDGGSWGHGGGVMAIEICSRCHRVRTIDTWHDDGRGGHCEALRYSYADAE